MKPALLTRDERRVIAGRMGREDHRKWLKERLLTQVRDVVDGRVDPGSLAGQLADEIAILEEDRIRDPLTGAFNRGLIGAVLNQEIVLEREVKKKMGLILVDIDNFKNVNDEEPDGHAAGDRVLVEVTKLLREISGPHCLVGRWGGEEFVIVVPHVTEESMAEMAEDVGSSISGWLAQRSKVVRSKITASMGVCVVKDGESAVDLIGRADKLMYQAKEAGRARLIMEVAGKTVEIKLG